MYLEIIYLKRRSSPYRIINLCKSLVIESVYWKLNFNRNFEKAARSFLYFSEVSKIVLDKTTFFVLTVSL
jgi:hypothetical protein